MRVPGALHSQWCQSNWVGKRKCFGGIFSGLISGLDIICLELCECICVYIYIQVYTYTRLHFIYIIFTLMKWSCTLAKHFKEMNLAEILLGKQTEWCYKDLKAVSKTEIPLRPVLGALPGYKIHSSLRQHLWEFWVRKAKFHRQDGQNKAVSLVVLSPSLENLWLEGKRKKKREL